MKSLDLISGGLVSELMSAIGRVTSNSDPVIRARLLLNLNSDHHDIKNLFARAIAVASKGVRLKKEILKAFISDPKNRSAIIEWIVKDMRYVVDPDPMRFDMSYAVNRTERANLERFIMVLFREIKAAKEKMFSPEATNMIAALHGLIDKVDEVDQKMGLVHSELLSRIEQLKRLMLATDRHPDVERDAGGKELERVAIELPLELRVWVQLASAPLVSRTLHPSPGQINAVYQVGDHLRIGFRTNQDAYVYLLDVDAGGRVARIFPSSVWPENQVRGGQINFIPKERDAHELPVSEPTGVETLIAIAIVEPLSIFAEWQTVSQVLPLMEYLLTQQDLTRTVETLSRLSGSQWTLGEYQFSVRK